MNVNLRHSIVNKDKGMRIFLAFIQERKRV